MKKTFFKLPLVIVAGVLACSNAGAQQSGGVQMKGSGMQMSGVLSAKGLSVQIIALDPLADNFVAAASAGAAGCGGYVAGAAKPLDRQTLQLTPRPSETESSCRVTIRFNKSFKSATVEEENCFEFHGAACEFAGTVRRVLD